METAVIFNMGRDAQKAGAARSAPLTVMYPVQRRNDMEVLQTTHHVEAGLSRSMQQAWVDGYDHQASGKRQYRALGWRQRQAAYASAGVRA